MRRIHSKPALFAAFADLETAFEPIEQCLSDLVAAIDEAVDLEVQSAKDVKFTYSMSARATRST